MLSPPFEWCVKTKLLRFAVQGIGSIGLPDDLYIPLAERLRVTRVADVLELKESTLVAIGFSDKQIGALSRKLKESFPGTMPSELSHHRFEDGMKFALRFDYRSGEAISQIKARKATLTHVLRMAWLIDQIREQDWNDSDPMFVDPPTESEQKEVTAELDCRAIQAQQGKPPDEFYYEEQLDELVPFEHRVENQVKLLKTSVMFDESSGKTYIIPTKAEREEVGALLSDHVGYLRSSSAPEYESASPELEKVFKGQADLYLLYLQLPQIIEVLSRWPETVKLARTKSRDL